MTRLIVVAFAGPCSGREDRTFVVRLVDTHIALFLLLSNEVYTNILTLLQTDCIISTRRYSLARGSSLPGLGISAVPLATRRFHSSCTMTLTSDLIILPLALRAAASARSAFLAVLTKGHRADDAYDRPGRVSQPLCHLCNHTGLVGAATRSKRDRGTDTLTQHVVGDRHGRDLCQPVILRERILDLC